MPPAARGTAYDIVIASAFCEAISFMRARLLRAIALAMTVVAWAHPAALDGQLAMTVCPRIENAPVGRANLTGPAQVW